jgi:hypothetical protein
LTFVSRNFIYTYCTVSIAKFWSEKRLSFANGKTRNDKAGKSARPRKDWTKMKTQTEEVKI